MAEVLIKTMGKLENGSFDVYPRNGTELSTNFTLSATGWTVFGTDVKIEHRFGVCCSRVSPCMRAFVRLCILSVHVFVCCVRCVCVACVHYIAWRCVALRGVA